MTKTDFNEISIKHTKVVVNQSYYSICGINYLTGELLVITDRGSCWIPYELVDINLKMPSDEEQKAWDDLKDALNDYHSDIDFFRHV